MTKTGFLRRLGTVLVTGLLSVSLLAGCGGGGGNGTPEGPKQTKVAPTETFKYGNHEAKVYELTGFDLKEKINTFSLAVLEKEIFFQCGKKPLHMGKVTLNENDATIADFVDLGECGDNNSIAANDKVAMWQGPSSKMVTYDGKQANINGRWPGQIITKTGRGGIAGREEFYYLSGKSLNFAKIKDGTIKDNKEIVKNLNTVSPDFQRVQFFPVSSDETGIYLRCIMNPPGDNRRIPVLVAFDKDGKELHRYEGVPGGRRDFCVTDKYVVYGDNDGNIRVYDKKSGKLIGDANVTFRPFALCTIKNNEILIYDDINKTLYRVEL